MVISILGSWDKQAISCNRIPVHHSGKGLETAQSVVVGACRGCYSHYDCLESREREREVRTGVYAIVVKYLLLINYFCN